MAVRKVFSLALLALTACAEQPWEWASTGNSAVPLQTAMYECERDTRMASASFGYGVIAQMQAEAFAVRCMSSKGYYQRTAGQTAPTGAPAPEYVRYREDLDAWYKKWEACKAQHRSTAARERCVGRAPKYDAATAPASGESYESRHATWFQRFVECDAQHGTVNGGNARLGCSGLPPSS